MYKIIISTNIIHISLYLLQSQVKSFMKLISQPSVLIYLIFNY